MKQMQYEYIHILKDDVYIIQKNNITDITKTGKNKLC